MKRYVAALVPIMLSVAGCSDSPGPEWKKSGTDVTRKIDHYYLKSSVTPMGAGAIKVKTKILAQKGNKDLAKKLNIDNAYSVETEGVIYCQDSAFMVLSKEYLDKQGISLKIEKDGGHEGAIVTIKPGQALHPMVTELCAQAAAAPAKQADRKPAAEGKPAGGQPGDAKPASSPVKK